MYYVRKRIQNRVIQFLNHLDEKINNICKNQGEIKSNRAKIKTLWKVSRVDRKIRGLNSKTGQQTHSICIAIGEKKINSRRRTYERFETI